MQWQIVCGCNAPAHGVDVGCVVPSGVDKVTGRVDEQPFFEW